MTKTEFNDTVMLEASALKFKTYCGDSVVANAELALIDSWWYEMSTVLYRLSTGVSAVFVDVERSKVAGNNLRLLQIILIVS